MHTQSLISVRDKAETFPPFFGLYPTIHPETKKSLVPFHLTPEDYRKGLPPVGLIHQEVRHLLKGNEDFQFIVFSQRPPDDVNRVKSNDNNCAQDIPEVEAEHGEENGEELRKKFNIVVCCITFSDHINSKGRQGRTDAMKRLAESWRRDNTSPKAMKCKLSLTLDNTVWKIFFAFIDETGTVRWMDEPFPIYASPFSSVFVDDPSTKEPFGNIGFEIERAITPIFGFAAFGVHLTAYEGQDDEMKVWIPKRSANRIRSPLNVGGGIEAGLTPFQCLLKESVEEAGWSEGFMRKYAKNVGVTSHLELREGGSLSPEVDYIYDLKMPPRDSQEYEIPKPNDEEVDSFQLLSIPEIKTALHNGDFSPSAGLITLDFLIRHGFVTPENEVNHLEIVRRCHRVAGVAGPGIGPF